MSDATPSPALLGGPAPDPMFPRLSGEQIARLAPFARPRRFADGDVVWEAGDRNRPMFVVIEALPLPPRSLDQVMAVTPMSSVAVPPSEMLDVVVV